MIAAPEHFALYGTRQREAQPILLTAGKLSVRFAEGTLKTICYDGVEVLRAIAYLVRDRDWGTYGVHVDDLDLYQGDGRFAITYSVRYAGPSDTELTVRVSIRAEPSGVLTFEADALSQTGFTTNRCGFCILHPIVGLAGAPVTIEHVDGGIEETRLPYLIEPWQPFKNMRAIMHTVMPGVTAGCRMEGDTFEMEDQRNWSDASFKTYVRPLALPWPYQILPAVPVKSRVILTILDKRKSRQLPYLPLRQDQPVVITRGSKTGNIPHIGLVVTPEEAVATLGARRYLDDIGPQELLFHFDPLAGHGAKAFKDFAAVAAIHKGSSTVEIALPCRRDPAAEVNEVAAHMDRAGFRPHAIVISPSVDRQSTPPGSTWPKCPPLEEVYDAARNAFPHVRLGGGMLSYFTELNRKRVPASSLDFITHCTNPIVHASDDKSVMQTLETLPYITGSVRAIYGDKAYRLGPSTIPMRQNPYGSRTMENPDGARIAMANTDPRHNGVFAEAFAMAYAIKVIDAGLECLTLSALTGSFGLIAGKGEPVAEGSRRPLFNTVKWLAGVAESKWQECISSEPTQILALIAQCTSGAFLRLVNIASEPKAVDLRTFDQLGNDAKKVLTLGPLATASLSLKD